MGTESDEGFRSSRPCIVWVDQDTTRSMEGKVNVIYYMVYTNKRIGPLSLTIRIRIRIRFPIQIAWENVYVFECEFARARTLVVSLVK